MNEDELDPITDEIDEEDAEEVDVAEDDEGEDDLGDDVDSDGGEEDDATEAEDEVPSTPRDHARTTARAAAQEGAVPQQRPQSSFTPDPTIPEGLLERFRSVGLDDEQAQTIRDLIKQTAVSMIQADRHVRLARRAVGTPDALVEELGLDMLPLDPMDRARPEGSLAEVFVGAWQEAQRTGSVAEVIDRMHRCYFPDRYQEKPKPAPLPKPRATPMPKNARVAPTSTNAAPAPRKKSSVERLFPWATSDEALRELGVK